jgi:hypothetical protein
VHRRRRLRADGTCDNDSSTLRVAVCIGQNDPNLATCTPPAAFPRLKVNKRPQPALPATMEGSACGGFIDLPVGVKVKRNGRKSDRYGFTKEPSVIVWFALASIASTSKGCGPDASDATNSGGTVTLRAVAGRVAWKVSTMT